MPILMSDVDHRVLELLRLLEASDATEIVVVDDRPRFMAVTPRMLDLIVAVSNPVSFADLRELKAAPPERPREPRRVAPVLGPPPSNPRNAGMDIRRFTPRRAM